MGIRERAPAASRARHSGFFVLRTPYLPFHILSDLSAALAAPTAEPSARTAALTGDRITIRERLRALVERPAVRDAIHVASPDLSRSIPVWLESPDSDRGTAIERALYRYVTRMAARPTPFGLFAGTGVGAIGADTRLSLAPQAAAGRHTRLDMDYLARLSEVLARDPVLAADAPLRAEQQPASDRRTLALRRDASGG